MLVLSMGIVWAAFPLIVQIIASVWFLKRFLATLHPNTAKTGDT
jgi:hypothetical protein